ncbi:hypothetical protein L596_015262 [Steinernema carpocapsae]|uniref:Uncharacterized protein n=1 Tax=Steinernema carpocapsae TaxID=34508 RepID=A0A4V6A325_STECR|nr:hypothetical protein L596_015262 [Steinernema carpocapsae]
MNSASAWIGLTIFFAIVVTALIIAIGVFSFFLCKSKKARKSLNAKQAELTKELETLKLELSRAKRQLESSGGWKTKAGSREGGVSKSGWNDSGSKMTSVSTDVSAVNGATTDLEKSRFGKSDSAPVSADM